MKSSESIKNIIPALLKAQQQMGAATKDSKNPFFKSSYADYGAVLEACKQPLNDNGIVILQPQHTNEYGTFVETLLLHSSGEWVGSETKVVYGKENDAQAQGSAISYSRRYGLQSLISLPAEDDDGNKASAKSAPSYKAPEATVSAVASFLNTVPTNTIVETPAPTKKTSGFRRIGGTPPVTAAASVPPTQPVSEGIEY
jgi:hypothetical protein